MKFIVFVFVFVFVVIIQYSNFIVSLLTLILIDGKGCFPSIGYKNNYLYQYTDYFKIALFALRILKNNYSQKG